MATVQLEHVRKVYEGGFEAVHDFNLAIKEREFIVLVGPSGCGKSTTLRMIAGLEEITSGTISIGGKVVNDVAPKDRDIAMVFQNYALYPHMTVFENMAFALKLRKLPKRGDRRTRSSARRSVLGIVSELEQAAQAAVGRAAPARRAGARHRARAAVLPVRRAAVQPRREAARRDARRDQAPAPELDSTTVYVTHDQEEAMTLGDRVVVMKDGVVQQCASALEIYQHPANRFVAGFLGTPPMNFFEGRVVDEGGRLWFDEGTRQAAGAGARGARAAARARGGRRRRRDRRAARGAGRGRRRRRAGGADAGDEGLAGAAAGREDGRLSADRTPRAHRRARGRVRRRRGGARGRRYGAGHPVDMERAHFFEPGDVGAAIA